MVTWLDYWSHDLTNCHLISIKKGPELIGRGSCPVSSLSSSGETKTLPLYSSTKKQQGSLILHLVVKGKVCVWGCTVNSGYVRVCCEQWLCEDVLWTVAVWGCAVYSGYVRVCCVQWLWWCAVMVTEGVLWTVAVWGCAVDSGCVRVCCGQWLCEGVLWAVAVWGCTVYSGCVMVYCVQWLWGCAVTVTEGVLWTVAMWGCAVSSGCVRVCCAVAVWWCAVDSGCVMVCCRQWLCDGVLWTVAMVGLWWPGRLCVQATICEQKLVRTESKSAYEPRAVAVANRTQEQGHPGGLLLQGDCPITLSWRLCLKACCFLHIWIKDVCMAVCFHVFLFCFLRSINSSLQPVSANVLPWKPSLCKSAYEPRAKVHMSREQKCIWAESKSAYEPRAVAFCNTSFVFPLRNAQGWF